VHSSRTGAAGVGRRLAFPAPSLEGSGPDDHPGHSRAAGVMRCVLMRVALRSSDGSEARCCAKHHRHCERSEAIQGRARDSGLLRFARNDVEGARYIRAVIVRESESGRSSIPEAVVIQPRGRGALATRLRGV